MIDEKQTFSITPDGAEALDVLERLDFYSRTRKEIPQGISDDILERLVKAGFIEEGGLSP